MPPIVHLTSSVYLFARIDGSLHLGLIEHPRVGGLLIAGGHVETTVEMPSDAALRETAEETGFHARLVPRRTSRCPLATRTPRSPARGGSPGSPSTLTGTPANRTSTRTTSTSPKPTSPAHEHRPSTRSTGCWL